MTSTFPKSELYGLVSQMNRATVSVPSNIAEGCAKSSEKDFGRFLQIALGSLYELETLFLLSEDLGYINEPTNKEEIKELIFSLQKRISGLLHAVGNKDRRL